MGLRELRGSASVVTPRASWLRDRGLIVQNLLVGIVLMKQSALQFNWKTIRYWYDCELQTNLTGT